MCFRSGQGSNRLSYQSINEFACSFWFLYALKNCFGCKELMFRAFHSNILNINISLSCFLVNIYIINISNINLSNYKMT